MIAHNTVLKRIKNFIHSVKYYNSVTLTFKKISLIQLHNNNTFDRYVTNLRSHLQRFWK